LILNNLTYLFHSKKTVFLLTVIFALLISSCNPLGKLKKNEYLLFRNVIKIDNKKVNQDDINTYIKQQPNRRILGIRFHLGVYNIANRGKEGRIKKWMKNTVGEPPVILDTSITSNSVKQIKLYLRDKGYFNATVSKRILYRKKNC